MDLAIPTELRDASVVGGGQAFLLNLTVTGIGDAGQGEGAGLCPGVTLMGPVPALEWSQSPVGRGIRSHWKPGSTRVFRCLSHFRILLRRPPQDAGHAHRRGRTKARRPAFPTMKVGKDPRSVPFQDERSPCTSNVRGRTESQVRNTHPSRSLHPSHIPNTEIVFVINVSIPCSAGHSFSHQQQGSVPCHRNHPCLNPLFGGAFVLTRPCT